MAVPAVCVMEWDTNTQRINSKTGKPRTKEEKAMKPIEFDKQTVVIAKDQEEYQSLPAHQSGDAYGTITFCWQLTWKERMKLFLTGKLWHSVLTFYKPLQPQLIFVDKPEMKIHDEQWVNRINKKRKTA